VGANPSWRWPQLQPAWVIFGKYRWVILGARRSVGRPILAAAAFLGGSGPAESRLRAVLPAYSRSRRSFCSFESGRLGEPLRSSVPWGFPSLEPSAIGGFEQAFRCYEYCPLTTDVLWGPSSGGMPWFQTNPQMMSGSRLPYRPFDGTRPACLRWSRRLYLCRMPRAPPRPSRNGLPL
jgi:hypothetical protein